MKFVGPVLGGKRTRLSRQTGYETSSVKLPKKVVKIVATVIPCRKIATLIKTNKPFQINLLIEELGLEQVRDTNVGRLTRSEIRRLNVACQLLLDMAILILDQPTKEMDIFDTFFLVEYLRNWASTGRVVIMSLHPPTYEIFAMLTKVGS